MSAAWTTLTRADLKGFDKPCVELVIRAMKLGATGKVSRNNHVILRTKDGQTIALTRRHSKPNRTAKNQKAEFERLFA